MNMEGTNTKAQYWATFAAALATMTSMVAFSWTTPVIPKLHNNETVVHVTDDEISWIVVALSPGVIIGNIATKYLSDNTGRRTTLLASAVPFCLGTPFILFTTKVWMIYIARILWGIGAGIIQTVAMIYLAEIASKEIRGSLVVINRFMFNFGALLVISIGSFVSYQTLSYMLIVLPVSYFIACLCIPETPYYLLKEGKVNRARKALMMLNGCKDENILEPKLTEMRIHVQEEMRRSATVKELFTEIRYRKALIVAFGLRTCQLMSGSIPLQQYLGRIMQDTKSSVSISAGLILFGALKFVSTIVSSGIIDKVGRRPLLISTFIGSSLSLAVVGTCFFVHDVYIVQEYSNVFGNIIFFGIIVFSVISTIGYDTVIHVIPAEVFPLNVKSIAMTSMNLFGGVVTFSAVRGYQVFKDLTGLCGVFWIFALMCLIGGIFSYIVVPETKGKSLKEIQMELQGSLYSEGDTVVKLISNNEIKSELKTAPSNVQKAN